MPRFRKRPVVIDAWFFDGSWASAGPIISEAPPGMYWSDSQVIRIPTLEGERTASARPFWDLS